MRLKHAAAAARLRRRSPLHLVGLSWLLPRGFVGTRMTDLGGWRVGTEEFLGAVLASVAQPVWVVDPGGLIRFANPAAVDALGHRDAGDLLGRPSHETIHYRRPDGSPFPASECPMLLPRLTGETVSSELDWFVRSDGSMIPVSYVSVPIDMPDGRGAVVAFTDISERVAAERILRERDAILAAVRQPVWMIDHEGRIRFANPAALAVLGYDRLAQLEGRPAHATVHHTRRDGSAYPVADCPLARCRVEGGTIEAGEEDWIRRDGSFVRIGSTPRASPANCTPSRCDPACGRSLALTRQASGNSCTFTAVRFGSGRRLDRSSCMPATSRSTPPTRRTCSRWSVTAR
jgi:PAS domain S-box-containing protein